MRCERNAFTIASSSRSSGEHLRSPTRQRGSFSSDPVEFTTKAQRHGEDDKPRMEHGSIHDARSQLGFSVLNLLRRAAGVSLLLVPLCNRDPQTPEAFRR